MPIHDFAFGRYDEILQPDCLRAVFAELVVTFFFVVIGEGSAIAFDKLTNGTTLTPVGLLIAAFGNGFGIYSAISVAFNVSGGHVNPAVTVGLLVGGYITVVKSIFYIIAQVVGASIACLVLKVVTNGASLPVHGVTNGEPVYTALLLEIVITFILLYTIYALAVDSRSKIMRESAPLTVGLTVVAIILFGGPFDGASMNPARSFGPALVAWNWKNHWVYWVGPLLGGALAGLVYELIYIGTTVPHHRILDDY